MARRLILIGTAGVLLLWAVAAAQQGQPRPGPGSGIVTVAGTVTAANLPTVATGNGPAVPSAQAGEWKMVISNTPTVTSAPLPFVTAGSSYVITWSATETERVAIAALGPGAWARISAPTERWVNLAAARSIEAAR